MSGHSKWSTIKRKKGALDAKRGKIFTKCIHEITTAVREGGGGDPDGNARLRLAIEKARAVNMPSTNIERAIKRATGEAGADTQVELVYEGYGPNGTAFLVQVLTDNKNRTVGEVRHAFNKCGGNLGESGCVGYLFKKKGILIVTADNEEELMEVAIESGADDIERSDEIWEVTCAPEALLEVKAGLESKFIVDSAEIEMVPGTLVPVQGEDSKQTMRLIDLLEDLDDVVNVFVNCDFVDGEQ